MPGLTFEEGGPVEPMASATLAPGQRAPRQALSAWSILQQSSKLSGAKVLSVLIQLPIGIVVARALRPELLGVVGYVALWQFYAGLTKPGMFSAAQRALPVLLAQGKTAEATRLQNLGVTGDGLSVLVAAGVLFVAAFFQSHALVRGGLMVGAAVFLMTQACDMVTGLQFAPQRFGLMAKTTVLSTLVSAAFVLSSIGWLHIYSPLLKSAVAACAVLIGCRLWAPSLGIRWRWERGASWRLLRLGVPLSLGGVFYWGLRTMDQMAVAMGLTLTEMGYLTFVMQFIGLGILLVVDFTAVMQPRLWAELGRVASPHVLGAEVRQVMVWLFVITCAMASCAQAGFGALVHWCTPNYLPAVGVFEIYAFLLVCGTMHIIPSYLLNSSTLNKQHVATAIWGAGLVLTAGLAYLAVHSGWGLRGVALCSVGAQTLVSAALLVAIRSYVFNGSHGQWSFYSALAGLLAITGAVFALYQFGPLS